MEEKITLAPGAERLSFLFKKISMPKACMATWLSSEEMVQELLELVQYSETIDDYTFLRLAEKVYDEMSSHHKDFPNFRFHSARKGMNHLRRALAEQEAKNNTEVV